MDKGNLKFYLEAIDWDIQKLRGKHHLDTRKIIYKNIIGEVKGRVGIQQLTDALNEKFNVSQKHCLAIQHSKLKEYMKNYFLND